MPAIACPGCQRMITYLDSEAGNCIECAACAMKFYLPGGSVAAPAHPRREGYTPPPEPWYYQYIVMIAWSVFGLNIGCAALAGLAFFPTQAMIDYPNLRGLLPFFILLWFFALLVYLLMQLVFVAVILLAVDAARNIRLIRHRDGP